MSPLQGPIGTVMGDGSVIELPLTDLYYETCEQPERLIDHWSIFVRECEKCRLLARAVVSGQLRTGPHLSEAGRAQIERWLEADG
jgi:hypothetical protein